MISKLAGSSVHIHTHHGTHTNTLHQRKNAKHRRHTAADGKRKYYKKIYLTTNVTVYVTNYRINAIQFTTDIHTKIEYLAYNFCIVVLNSEQHIYSMGWFQMNRHNGVNDRGGKMVCRALIKTKLGNLGNISYVYTIYTKFISPMTILSFSVFILLGH